MNDSAPRRLRDAIEPIVVQGFSAARQPLRDLGLRMLPGYVWSRAAALGEPVADVVVATFGVFEPGFLAVAYETGRASVSRDTVLAIRSSSATAALEEVLGDDAEVEALATMLLDALDGVAATGRPLFAGSGR